MKKATAMICLVIGCLLVGIVIASFFQGRSNQQIGDYSARRLTEEEKEEVIKIALDNASVKEILRGKEYSVEEVGIAKIGRFEEHVWQEYPIVRIYIERKYRIDVIVDLENKKVISVVGLPYREVMPREITEEEREEAIKIALDNESVKGKLEGLGYKISHVRASEGRVDKGRMRTPTYDVHVRTY